MSAEKEIEESMGIESISSSFMVETRNKGLKSSSFVSYTVKCRNEEGWSVEEARLVEAILARRVGNDLYADLGCRGLVDMRQAVVQQEMIQGNYNKLIEKTMERMVEAGKTSDQKKIVVEVEEMAEA